MHVGAIVDHRYLAQFGVFDTRLELLLKVFCLFTVQ